MIHLIPAIDLMEGRCVRLRQGDFHSAVIYSDDPLARAQAFEKAGVKYLHVVDLDGARTGIPVNIRVLEKLIKETSLKIDYGGGIRELKTIRQILRIGVHRLTIGSLAITRPDKLLEWIELIGANRFILGADISDDKLVYHGWQEISSVTWREFIGRWSGAGITRFMATDIRRDGMMQGVAIRLYREIKSQYPDIELIASGGVSGWEDIQALKKMELSGVIIGKAYYTGKITLEQIRKYNRSC